jgi:hypothetical protein
MTFPEDGHQFHFSVRPQGSYRITGETGYADSGEIGEPFRITVRAWNLRDACLVAAQAAMADWAHINEDEDDGRLYAVAKVLKEAHAVAYHASLVMAHRRGTLVGPEPDFNPDVTDVEMWLDQARALDDAGMLKE